MYTQTTPLKPDVVGELMNYQLTSAMGHSFCEARHGWVLEMEGLEKMQDWWSSLSSDLQSDFLEIIDLPEPMGDILSHSDETFRKMAYLVWTVNSRIGSGQ